MDELISRQAVKEMMKNHRVDFSTEKDYRTARACANAVPPAEPLRIRGQWSIKGQAIDTVRGYWAICSACGRAVFGGGNYCSNCGSCNKGEVIT